MKTLLLGAALAALFFGPASAAPKVSQADKAQAQEDMAIIKRPVHIVRDNDPDAKLARLSSCVEYWEANLSRDRAPEARRALMAVRIARCMFRTNYTIMQGPCKPVKAAIDHGIEYAFTLAKQGSCYVKFDRVLPERVPLS